MVYDDKDMIIRVKCSSVLGVECLLGGVQKWSWLGKATHLSAARSCSASCD